MPLTIHLDPDNAEWAEALERLKHGERVLLACGDDAVLVGSETEGEPTAAMLRRGYGIDRGRISIADDFDKTPDWLLDAFEGAADEPLV